MIAVFYTFLHVMCKALFIVSLVNILPLMHILSWLPMHVLWDFDYQLGNVLLLID